MIKVTAYQKELTAVQMSADCPICGYNCHAILDLDGEEMGPQDYCEHFGMIEGQEMIFIQE